MRQKKLFKAGIIVAVTGIIIAGSIGLYLFNMPHRDVQSAKTDYQLSAATLVAEYFEDRDAANEKYLAADGDSKILEVSGNVYSASEDFSGKKVVILKATNDKAGVSCTFEGEIPVLAQGSKITVKGVIHAGAYYDADMELYQDAVLNNCVLVN